METSVSSPESNGAWIMGWIGLAIVDGVQHVTIAGDPDGPLMCGDLLEVRIAGRWLRGRVYHLPGLGAQFQDQVTGHISSYGGWYWSAAAEAWDGNVMLLPGMMARRVEGPYWPEPENPFEGQRWHRDVGEVLIYTGGGWAEQEEANA
ncbi:MAG TPA: hypothetical protein VK191_15675 [Symbiobacteriaceae bacterium]|nr:hypothetical protein [Symbiobacteriaceae bacterium]